MIKIEADELSKEISKALNQYSDEVSKITKEEIDNLSKEIVNDLKSDPVIPEKTGGYKKSFTFKTLEQGVFSKINAIYSKKPYYRLTHLLEKGHALPQGGRSKAFPHWNKSEKKSQELPERIKRRIEE